MRILFLIFLLSPCLSYAAESINCHFNRFHQVNHEVPDVTGYADLEASIAYMYLYKYNYEYITERY